MPALLTAQNCESHIHLVLGTNALAASRIAQSLAAGARPVVVVPLGQEQQLLLDDGGVGKAWDAAFSARVEAGEATVHRENFGEKVLMTLGRDEVGGVVDAVFVTDSKSVDGEFVF